MSKKSPTMKLVDIQFTAKELMRAGRNMDIALTKPRMERLIKISSEEEYETLEKIVKDLDCNKLKRWAHNHSSKGLEDLSMTELRDKAKKFNIKNAARMGASELLEKVQHEINNKHNRRNDGDDHRDDTSSEQV